MIDCEPSPEVIELHGPHAFSGLNCSWIPTQAVDSPGVLPLGREPGSRCCSHLIWIVQVKSMPAQVFPWW